MAEAEVFNGSGARVTHVSSILVNPHGRVPLALQAANGEWSLPKGMIEMADSVNAAYTTGETPAHVAALRESKEEVGVRPASIVALRSLGAAVRTSAYREVAHHVEYFGGFVHKTRKEALRPTAPQSEIIRADFFNLEEALDALKNPTDQAVLRLGHAALCEEFQITLGRAG